MSRSPRELLRVFSVFTRGARVLHLLSTLKPGEHCRFSANEWSDIEVPANPLDRQTPEFLMEYFRSRMRFPCRAEIDIVTGAVTFSRLHG